MLVHEVTCPNELNSRQIHHQVTHLHLNYCLSVFRVARQPADDGFWHGIYPYFEGCGFFFDINRRKRGKSPRGSLWDRRTDMWTRERFVNQGKIIQVKVARARWWHSSVAPCPNKQQTTPTIKFIDINHVRRLNRSCLCSSLHRFVAVHSSSHHLSRILR